MDTSLELLDFFKALADDTRLKIVGLLALESRTAEQLAALLDRRRSTVAHHLARLAEAGLVSAAREGQSPRYALRLDALHETARRLLAEATAPPTDEAPDLDTYDRTVLQHFLRRDGSLKEIPAQEKKLLAVLRHVLNAFEPDCPYPEKQVNAIIARFHPDTASLRRALIDYRLMRRAAGQYWRGEGPMPIRAP